MNNSITCVRLTLLGGNTITTMINATLSEARAYYLGRSIQQGDTEEHPYDLMLPVVSVEDYTPTP